MAIVFPPPINAINPSVLTSGADSTGIADATSVIQAAITALPNNSYGVFAPGIYKCGNLQIADKTNVVIDGAGAAINWTGTAGSGNIGFQYVGTVTNLTICNFVLNGDGVLANGHAGVWGFSGQTLTNIKILYNYITNIIVGISLNADMSGSITGGLIEGNFIDTVVGILSGSGYGITHSNGSGNASHVRIVNNIISRAQRHSIYQAKGSGVVIEGNTIRLHRTGQTLGGSPLSAIVCSRSTDVSIVGNTIDTYNDSAFEVSPAAGFNSRNVVFANNTLSNPVGAGTVDMIIGSSSPASDGFSEEILIANNSIYRSAIYPPSVVLYSGKRISLIGNNFYLVGIANASGIIYIYGVGETAGTTAYTDDLSFKDNFFFTDTGGPNAIEFRSAAATSGIRIDAINNRGATVSNFWAFDVAQTDPNIRVLNTPVTGLDLTKLAPIDGPIELAGQLYPATPALAGQLATAIYAGTGAPSNANGNNGDIYFRSDGGALTTIYQRRAGAWVGII